MQDTVTENIEASTNFYRLCHYFPPFWGVRTYYTKTLVLDRSPMLNNFETGQYLDGWALGKNRYCKLECEACTIVYRNVKSYSRVPNPDGVHCIYLNRKYDREMNESVSFHGSFEFNSRNYIRIYLSPKIFLKLRYMCPLNNIQNVSKPYQNCATSLLISVSLISASFGTCTSV